MIFNIDHIAVTPSSIEKSIEFLRLAGYTLKFKEKNLRNPSVKKPFMAEDHLYHDLFFYTKDNSFNIEIINYGTKPKKVSPIVPLFSNFQELDIKFSLLHKRKIQSFILKEVYVDGFEKVLVEEDISSNFIFNKVFWYVNNVRNSILFWNFFGFKTVEFSPSFGHLEFKTHLYGKTFHIFLVHREEFVNNSFLDDGGFNCIAFISNSPFQELLNLKRLAIETTAIEKVNVDSKDLYIFFAIGPNRELVEIVGRV